MKTTLTLIIILLTGCTQRIAVYNPKTGEIFYKSNSIASDTTADVVRIKLGKTEIEVGKLHQDNDSVKIITPYGWMETESEAENE